jgi:hypothetical protein
MSYKLIKEKIINVTPVTVNHMPSCVGRSSERYSGVGATVGEHKSQHDGARWGFNRQKHPKTTRTLAQIKYSWMGGSIFPCCTYRCHFFVAITNVFSNTVAIGDKRGGKGDGSNPGAHVPKSQDAGEILNGGEGHFLAKAIFFGQARFQERCGKRTKKDTEQQYGSVQAVLEDKWNIEMTESQRPRLKWLWGTLLADLQKV